MEPIPIKLDKLGRLVIPREFRRKLGVLLDPGSKVTLIKSDNDTLIIQKAKKGCQSPYTKEPSELGIVEIGKELRESMGWNIDTHLGINDNIIAIRPLEPEQIEQVEQKEENRKSKTTIVG